MRKTRMLVLLTFVLMIVISGCGKNSDSDKLILKVATVLPSNHPSYEALEFFKQRLAQLSNGQIDVQLFGNSQLGKEAETIEMCQAGNIEMLNVSVAPLTQFVPELNALNMPFIFRDSEHAYRVVDGQIGQHFTDKLDSIDLHILCYFDAGSRNVMTKKGPITKPGDLKGMKIRVMGAPLMVATINALGASAIPMSQGEVYTALQTGVLDGWENNPPTTLSFKMYETGCMYYASTEHLMVPDLLVISKKLYDRLSDDDKAHIRQAAEETTKKQRQLWAQGEKETVDILKEKGMQFNDVKKSLFSERVQSIYEECYNKYGEDFKKICEEIKHTQ